MIRTADGHALKILARGDCTCRRSVALNKDLFERPPLFVQNEKSTFIQFLDAINGESVPEDFLREISDVDAMPRVLRSFYLGQAERSILHERDADLLMLDSYADMNFRLWENRDAGYKLWIHPKFVYDLPKFKATHRSLGHRALDQSVENAAAFVNYVRIRNPEIPVLFLNQQVEYYPKLADRAADFEKLGELLASRLPGVFYGGVVGKEDLELADLGSAGGPGNTLHFQAGTYRRMWDRAINAGLGEAIHRRRKLVGNSTAQTASESASGPSRPPGRPDNNPRRPGQLTYTKNPNRNLIITETIDVDLQVGSGACVERCQTTYEEVKRSLRNYVYLDGQTDTGLPPRFTPMLIDLEEFPAFDQWERRIKKFSGGARLRQKRKAQDAGYYTKLFPHRLHIPDLYEINTSRDERSGGPIRPNLTRSVEELGGAPDRMLGLPAVKCPRHWRQTFGVFLSEPGHQQGDVQVDERLVAYVSMLRRGEILVYSQFIGHGAHIPKGVLTLLHHDVIQYLYESDLGRASALRYIMYGGAENGGEGLYQFKHRAGFKPYIVNVPPA